MRTIKVVILIASICYSAQVYGQNSQGHDYVNLRLSFKWATCNVGASNPEDCGDYYAYGETSTSFYYGGVGYDWDLDIKDKRRGGISGTKFDVAHEKWGQKYRMPTMSEFDELLNEDNFT